MDKNKLVTHLRTTADELQPLTQGSVPGAAIWDGEKYVRGETKNPDPYALAWWSTLRAIAAMVEAQECALSSDQIAYLKSTFFGGMGSLSDLAPSMTQEQTERFNRRRNSLYSLFQ